MRIRKLGWRMEGRVESGRGRDEREKRRNKNIRDNRRISTRNVRWRKLRKIKRGGCDEFQEYHEEED